MTDHSTPEQVEEALEWADRNEPYSNRTFLSDEERYGIVLSAYIRELHGALGETIDLISAADYEPNFDAPNNDDMNRWNRVFFKMPKEEPR